MVELTECPNPPFWAVFIGLAEQAICDPSEFSNKEIAQTVASLSIESTMSPLPFELSQIITMVLAFIVLMEASFLSSPSNLMWLIKSVFSILYRWILEPYITLYKIVGPGKLFYLAFETFSMFVFIAFCYLYRGSIAGVGYAVRFHELREAQSIVGLRNIFPNCQLKECTVYLSAWCNKPFNKNAMAVNMRRKSEEIMMIRREGRNIELRFTKKFSAYPTEFVIIFKEKVGDLRARLRWTHAALLLLLVLIIQIPAVSATARLIPGILLQSPGWTAGLFLTCYRYIEAAVTAKAQLIPGIYDRFLAAAKEILHPRYQYVKETLENATARLRNVTYDDMNEQFLEHKMSKSLRAVEVGDEYEVVHDSKQAFVAQFRDVNKIVRRHLFHLLGGWFLFSLLPYIFHLLQERRRRAAERRRVATP